MKKTICSIFTICSCWLMTACTPRPYQAETKELQHYLNDNFKISLAAGKAVYLLVPGNQCGTCISWDAAAYPAAFLNNVYVISLFDTSHFIHFRHILNDPADKQLKLSFVNYANTMVLTDSGHIQSIIRLRDVDSQLDSLVKGGRF